MWSSFKFSSFVNTLRDYKVIKSTTANVMSKKSKDALVLFLMRNIGPEKYMGESKSKYYNDDSEFFLFSLSSYLLSI